MFNNSLLFRLYLLIVLCFLMFFSFLLSKQLFSIVYGRLSFVILLESFKKTKKLTRSTYLSFFKYYLSNSCFYLCSSISEFYLCNNSNTYNQKLVYNLLACLYYENSFWKISEYYYLKLLAISPLDCNVMYSLGRIYLDLGYIEKSKSLFNYISKVDPDYRLFDEQFD